MSIELKGYHEVSKHTNQSREITLNTTRGKVEGLYDEPANVGSRAIVWASGAKGGMDGPAYNLYPELAEYFLGLGIGSFRVNYRYPSNLDESVLDVLVAVWHMANLGYTETILIGHSFGGGVVLSASRYTTHVRGVIVIASQLNGAEEVVLLNGRPILIIHGQADSILPVSNSETIYEWASSPKQLAILPNAGHGLRECPNELRTLIKQWISKVLI